MMCDKNYEIWINIVRSMKSNNRPSIHGRLLNKLDLEKYVSKHTFEKIISYNDYDFTPITRDYLIKKDNSLRSNAYLVSIEVMLLINYFCYKIFEAYGERDNVYYSGNLCIFDMFYENSYSFFQKELFSIYSMYEFYIKVDIKNFYKNIDINKLSDKYVETRDLVSFLKHIGLDEFPILQDCSGLSYVATRLYLEDVDTAISKYIEIRADQYILLRYSDDLYILFNQSNQFGNVGDQDVQCKIKSEISDILNKYNLELNEKFVIEETSNLPNEVQTKLYDFYVSDEDFEIWEIIGGKFEIIEKTKEFITGLAQIKIIQEYTSLVRRCFSYTDKAHKFEKNFFNEILYNKNLSFMLRKDDIIRAMKEGDIVRSITFDPIRITRLILFSHDEGLIKKFLYVTFSKLECGLGTPQDIVALLIYITQRNIQPITKKKIINKLYNYDKELSYFLSKNLAIL